MQATKRSKSKTEKPEKLTPEEEAEKKAEERRIWEEAVSR
jgi:hypothetical protein